MVNEAGRLMTLKIKLKGIKVKIIVLAVSIILVVFLSSFLILHGKPAPTEFVTNRTVEISGDLLFSYEATKYPSGVEIIKPKLQESKLLVGLTVDPWDLKFGIIPSGGSFGTRHLILTNKQDKDVKVDLKVYGNISPMVSFSKNNFILSKNENVTIDVFCRTTDTTLDGNYTGEIDVIIKRPKYEFIYNFKWI